MIITCVKTVFDSNTNMDVKSAALDHMANLHTMLQFDTIKNMLIGWRYEKSYNFFESCHQIYWKTV